MGRILSQITALPAGGAVSDNDAKAALVELAGIVGGLGSGTAAQGLVPVGVKTSAYGAASGDLIPVDLSAGSVTVTLPAAPADGSRVAVKVVAYTGGNTATISRGGSDVFNKAGGATSLTLSTLFQAVNLQYSTSTGIWFVVGDNLALAQLDARYRPSQVLPPPTGNATLDTAALEAAFTAAGTDGTVTGHAGTYLLSHEVTRPANVWLEGQGNTATIFQAATDFGTGKYLIKPGTESNPPGGGLRNLQLHGPVSSGTIGSFPALMIGTISSAKQQLDNVLCQFFWAGAEIHSDHQMADDLWCRYNGYGIYFGQSTNKEDQHFNDCLMDANFIASVAVAGDQNASGLTWTRSHFGFSPFCIYKLAVTSEPQIIQNNVFVSCTFERYGNELIGVESGSATVQDVTFVGCREYDSFKTDYAWAGHTKDACIDVSSVIGLTLIGSSTMFQILGDVTSIKCDVLQFLDWKAADKAIAKAHTAGKPLIVASTYTDPTNRLYTGGGASHIVIFAGPTTQYDLWKLHPSSSTGSLYGTADTSAVLGVATITDPTAGSSTRLFCVSGWWKVHADTSLTSNTIVKPSTTTAGRVGTVAHGRPNAPIVGISRTAESSNLVSVLLEELGGFSTPGADIQVFTTSGTWTKPIGNYQTVEVIAIGGASGGGSGRRGAAGTVRCGGGGGGGGGMTRGQWPAASIGATEAVTVGTGGTGGAAVTADSTDGNPGAAGAASLFGLWLIANRSSTGGGGGTATTSTAGAAGGGQFTGSTGAVGSATGLAGVAGGNGSGGGAPGAAGAGITAANAASDGAAGGGHNALVSSGTNIRFGGTAGTSGGSGSAPAIQGSASDPVPGCGGGSGASSISTAAGAGGDGGLYGGGGGGGGASLNGNNSGKGGDGGAGIVVVICR